jgi:hypothetical protein
MSRQLPDDPSDDNAPAAYEIVSGILAEIGDLSRLMEIYYFSSEPEFFKIACWLASLSDDASQQLGEFVEAAGGQPIHIERPDATTLVMKRGES